MRIRRNRNNVREIKIRTTTIMEKENILNDQIGGTLITGVQDELVKMNPIEGTPFTLVTVKERGTFVALGRMRLTDSYEREADAVKQVNVNNWEFTIAVIYAVVDAVGHYNASETIDRLHEEE